MQKIFIGFLIGVFLVGIFWFFYGRPGIKDVRRDLNEVHAAYEQVQQALDSVTVDNTGFAGDFAELNSANGSALIRSDTIEEGLADHQSELGLAVFKMDELERLNISLIRLGRDFGDDAFDLRRFGETYGTNE